MLQIISSKDCKGCNDKCCRFAPHLLRFSPIFTEEEFNKVVKKSFSRGLFKKVSKDIYQLRLRKKEEGHYICPFLTEDDKCSIQKIKPYECEIWPFILMRGKGKNRNKVYLMIDEANECHAIEKASKEKIKKYIKYLKKYLESGRTIKLFRKYPKVISDYDCDLTGICYLKSLTKKVGGVSVGRNKQ